MLKRTPIPAILVRLGDVLEVDDQPSRVAVVTSVVHDSQKGNLHIHELHEDGSQREQVFLANSLTSFVTRLAEGCEPTPKGLQHFITWYLPVRRSLQTPSRPADLCRRESEANAAPRDAHLRHPQSA